MTEGKRADGTLGSQWLISSLPSLPVDPGTYKWTSPHLLPDLISWSEAAEIAGCGSSPPVSSLSNWPSHTGGAWTSRSPGHPKISSTSAVRFFRLRPNFLPTSTTKASSQSSRHHQYSSFRIHSTTGLNFRQGTTALSSLPLQNICCDEHTSNNPILTSTMGTTIYSRITLSKHTQHNCFDGKPLRVRLLTC